MAPIFYDRSKPLKFTVTYNPLAAVTLTYLFIYAAVHQPTTGRSMVVTTV